MAKTPQSDSWRTRLALRLQSCRLFHLTVTIDDLHRCREQAACTGDKRLKSLAAIHFVIGLVAGFLKQIDLNAPRELSGLLVVPLVASVLCQAFILALWGVISTASPWKRIAGLLAGSVYLETLWLLALEGELPATSTITIGVTTAFLLVLRANGDKFTRQVQDGSPAQPETERLRFSIRGLMLLTAAVALLSAIAKAFQGIGFAPNRLTLVNVFLALCFVTIGFVALWAVLGKAKPLVRGAVVFVVSPILGVFFAISVNAHQAGWVYIILSMLLYSAALLASLLVLRSCGYRFVRRVTRLTIQPSSDGNVGETFPVGHPAGEIKSWE